MTHLETILRIGAGVFLGNCATVWFLLNLPLMTHNFYRMLEAIPLPM